MSALEIALLFEMFAFGLVVGATMTYLYVLRAAAVSRAETTK